MVAFAKSTRRFEFPATTEQEARLYAAIVTNHYQLMAVRQYATALEAQLRRWLAAGYAAEDGHLSDAIRQLKELAPTTEKLLS